MESELLHELRELRREVKAAKADVDRLQNELSTVKAFQATPPPPVQYPAFNGETGAGTTIGPTGGRGELSPSEGAASEDPGPHSSGAPGNRVSEDNHPLQGSYRYHSNATGPLGGGGYFHISDANDEFTVNLSNQITIDGSFFDRQNIPTSFQGFFIPFARTFIYGNITKDWNYQIGTQGFAGQFNLLDMWMSYRFGDALTLRAGKGLVPPLYEYYAFSPALEPVISNSPLFQLAGKRSMGVMATGNLFDKRMQYWSGVTNTGTSFFYNIGRNMEYNGAVTFKPFQNADNFWNGLGGGSGFSAGYQQYALQQNNISFLNGAGEPNTNSAFVDASGVPFFVYNNNVSANGLRSRFAPHIFWFGRFSVLAEYMNFSRELTDGRTSGRSTQRAFYVNASYFLTGERDFNGSGFQAYSTISPLRPFIPSRGEWGPGAWQIAAQYAMFNAGTGDFARGFADPTTSASRLESVMVGVNWWPNKYTRLSCDYVWNGLNQAIPLTGPTPIDTYSTIWMRFAMYF